MHRLVNDRNALLPRLLNNELIQPPFYDAEISSKAFDDEVWKIYATASASTREIYDKGETPGQEPHKNPIIRWMLRDVLANRSRHT